MVCNRTTGSTAWNNLILWLRVWQSARELEHTAVTDFISVPLEMESDTEGHCLIHDQAHKRLVQASNLLGFHNRKARNSAIHQGGKRGRAEAQQMITLLLR